MPETNEAKRALLEKLAGNLLDMLTLLDHRMIASEQIMKQYNLTGCQLQTLAALRTGAVSVGKMAEMIGVAKPNMTPVLIALCERGLVERVRSEVDGRVVMARLTEDGKKMIEESMKCIAKHLVEVCSFTNNEIRGINTAISRIYARKHGSRGQNRTSSPSTLIDRCHFSTSLSTRGQCPSTA